MRTAHRRRYRPPTEDQRGCPRYSAPRPLSSALLLLPRSLTMLSARSCLLSSESSAASNSSMPASKRRVDRLTKPQVLRPSFARPGPSSTELGTLKGRQTFLPSFCFSAMNLAGVNVKAGAKLVPGEGILDMNTTQKQIGHHRGPPESPRDLDILTYRIQTTCLLEQPIYTPGHHPRTPPGIKK
jgi:hypothetical protein